MPHSFPPIPAFTVGTTDVSLGGHDTQSIAAGSYRSVSVNSHAVLNLSPGNYYIDSLTMGAQATINVTGATTLFIKSALTLDGQSIVNATADPTNLNIFYSGTNAATLVGGSGLYGEVYAPNAPVTLKGNSSFFGSFIGKTVNDSGTPDVHFDDGSLNKNLLPQPFRIITWSQDVY